MEWIDLHCHLDKLEEGPEAAIEKAKSVGVTTIVTIGTEPADHPVVLAIAQKHYPRVYCTLGVHPHEGVLFDEKIGDWMRRWLSRLLLAGTVFFQKTVQLPHHGGF